MFLKYCEDILSFLKTFRLNHLLNLALSTVGGTFHSRWYTTGTFHSRWYTTGTFHSRWHFHSFMPISDCTQFPFFKKDCHGMFLLHQGTLCSEDCDETK